MDELILAKYVGCLFYLHILGLNETSFLGSGLLTSYTFEISMEVALIGLRQSLQILYL